MAIPSRQIGWSTKANLLWQISKQLEYLTCVTAGGCGTTTTTTTSSVTNYNVAGCERMEYHVISYTSDTLSAGTIVNNDTPECWFIIDQTTEPADVGTVTYVWPALEECQPCIDSHTTTTTTTAAPTVSAYNYVIVSDDLLRSVDNTDPLLNDRMFSSTSNNGTGNPETIQFSTSGAYNNALCSLDPEVPTLGYWRENIFITTELLSSITNAGPC